MLSITKLKAIQLTLYFFNWFLIGRQLLNNVVLVSALQWHESAIGIQMSSLFLTSFPPPIPSCPSRLSQSTWLRSQCHRANSHWLSTLHMVVFMLQSTLSICPTLSFPHCVHKSILYVCISTAAPQIHSSVPFFQIPYICTNIEYLLFSFWLTSLCITSFKFIHLTRTHSSLFLFMTE